MNINVMLLVKWLIFYRFKTTNQFTPNIYYIKTSKGQIIRISESQNARQTKCLSFIMSQCIVFCKSDF